MKTKFIIILLFIITTLVVHAQSDDTRYKWNGRDSLGCLTTLNPNDNVSEYYYVEVIDTTLFFRDFLETFAQILKNERIYTNIPILNNKNSNWEEFLKKNGVTVHTSVLECDTYRSQSNIPVGLKGLRQENESQRAIREDFAKFISKHQSTDVYAFATSLNIDAKELEDYYRLIKRAVRDNPIDGINGRKDKDNPGMSVSGMMAPYKKASMLIPVYQQIILNYLEASNAYLSDKNSSSSSYDTLLDGILLYFPNLASTVETIISKHKIPMKILSFPNPYYKPIEKPWAWLNDNKKNKWEHIVEHYPEEINYYKHVDYPEYIVKEGRYDEEYSDMKKRGVLLQQIPVMRGVDEVDEVDLGSMRRVYKNGVLVAVSSGFFEEIANWNAESNYYCNAEQLLFYLWLFKNNKYNVDREPTYVKDAIIETIFARYGGWYVHNGKHKDETLERAKSYIKQLEKDYPKDKITIEYERVDGFTRRVYLYYEGELQFVLLQIVQEGYSIHPFVRFLPRLLQFESVKEREQRYGFYYTLELDETETTDNVVEETNLSSLSMGNDELSLAFVKGGTFLMGATGNVYHEEDALPVHYVRVSDFYIGKYEVTQSLWLKIMGYNPSHHKGSNLPVECVSWEECQKFIRRLNSRKAEFSVSDTTFSFRLPTEAEWEYAARGGNKSKGFDQWSGGEEPDTIAWFGWNSQSQKDKDEYFSHPVGKLKPNELGIYDMSGNVMEWCLDKYDEKFYSISPTTNPICQDSNLTTYVVRGGGSFEDWTPFSFSFRHGGCADGKDKSTGFRLVLAKKP